MMDYQSFLATKRINANPVGFHIASGDLAAHLYPFQRRIVEWAINRGRAAVFADCGLGKTPMQIEWARQVHEHTGKDVLILAPLAVSEQTRREGIKFGVTVNQCRTGEDVKPGINIANYEMLHHFDPSQFCGVVLDESSILKNYAGHYRQQLTEFASTLPYRLACTATPAPNDLIEIINHAEFLGIMQGKEIIALYFRQDGNTTHAWRLKGHAERDFWAWMASWAVAVRRPSDLGFDDAGFVLPELTIQQETVDGVAVDDMLFPIEAQTLDERRRARRASMPGRVEACAAAINASTEPWLVWCDLNAESEALKAAIAGSVEVRGSDSNEHKTDAMIGFSEGKYRVLVTKPSIAGFGMNWQHCARMDFVGLSDSWESYYQAIRRCWRFGQVRPVTARVVVSECEGAVVANIERKERQAAAMMENMVRHMNEYVDIEREDDSVYRGSNRVQVPGWILREGGYEQAI